MDLGNALRHSARRLPQKPAVICHDEAVSYQELDRATDALARWLLGQQLEDGEDRKSTRLNSSH